VIAGPKQRIEGRLHDRRHDGTGLHGRILSGSLRQVSIAFFMGEESQPGSQRDEQDEPPKYAELTSGELREGE